tara:strand:+ start:305 stop:430 length:126 start_codon:yes stop_codon:yes gene_type:complete
MKLNPKQKGIIIIGFSILAFSFSQYVVALLLVLIGLKMIFE